MLNKLHEQKSLSHLTNNKITNNDGAELIHDLSQVSTEANTETRAEASNDFVVICSNLDHFVTRAFYEHPQCCKLIMYEEGTSVYLTQLEVPNLGENYEGRIADFLLNHPE